MARATRSIKRTAAIIGAGAVGNVAGTLVGFAAVKNRPGGGRIGGHIGAGVGLAAGTAAVGWNARRHKTSTPSVQESTGTKDFKKRVGTKTNGRVGKRDNPYM